MKFTSRVDRMAQSATTAMANKARQKLQQGLPVISFSTGEPDFSSPKSAVEYARKAMDEGFTHYTATAGITELKRAIICYYHSYFGLEYSDSEIVAGTGAKQLLYEILGCLVEKGSEVIVIAPAWVSYVEQIRLFDGTPVIVETEKNGFVPDIDDIREKISDRTAAIIINSPNNPTGMVYREDFLADLGALAVEKDITVINDEVYERLVYGKSSYCHILNAAPQTRDNVVNINSASKSYAMTGWRLGFALGPEELVKKVIAFQSHLTSNTSSISQWAAVGAINEAQSDVERMREEFEERRTLIMGLLEDIDLYKLMDFIERDLLPVFKPKSGIGPLDLTFGFSGFHSSFLALFEKVAKEERVDLKRLIVEASKEDKRNPGEPLARTAAGRIKQNFG